MCKKQDYFDVTESVQKEARNFMVINGVLLEEHLDNLKKIKK